LGRPIIHLKTRKTPEQTTYRNWRKDEKKQDRRMRAAPQGRITVLVPERTVEEGIPSELDMSDADETMSKEKGPSISRGNKGTAGPGKKDSGKREPPGENGV